MTDKVWMSSVLSNYALSIDQGIRNKYYGYDWEEARIDGMNSPEEAHEARLRNERGFALCREDFPEASAVWNEKMYSKVHDFFRIGPFHAVKGKTAEVLSRFDLGDGGLIPYPIYKADLETPMDGEFFLLNFGARKDSFLPEQSENVAMRGVRAATGQQIWKINSWHGDGDVALAPSALEGSDLWFEEVVSYGEIFMSDTLAQALIDIGQKDLFALKECRIVEDGQ